MTDALIAFTDQGRTENEMTPEAKLKTAVLKLLKEMQRAGEPIWFFKSHGGPMQRAGLPDFHVTFKGRSVWIELKAGDGRLTPLQEATLKKIAAAGGVAVCCRSVEEVKKVLGPV